MALFKRRKNEDLAFILMQGEDMIAQAGRAHAGGWGLGTADTWAVDQATGVIRWAFPDKVAEAPVQWLGSHNASTGTWLWAWANASVLPHMHVDAERVRIWAEANGHTSMTVPKLEVDEKGAFSLAAIAFRVTGATGFYRGPGRTSAIFMTFGPVTITTADGQPTTFEINITD